MGYLDGNADWGPIENASYFLVPKIGYGTIKFAGPVVRNPIDAPFETFLHVYGVVQNQKPCIYLTP